MLIRFQWLQELKSSIMFNMHTNLILLAGGSSSRMKKEITTEILTEKQRTEANKRSKGLITIGNSNRPFLDFLLLNAQKAGYTNIYMVIGEEGALFRELYGVHKHSDFKNLNIIFATQYIPKNRQKPLGTADAVWQTIEQFPELNTQSYTVCNSDNLYSYKALYALRETPFLNAFISYERDALLFSSERIARFALTKLDAENTLVDIVEKPAIENITNYKDSEGKLRVSMNIFKFNGQLAYRFFKNCPIHPERQEKEIPKVLLQMIAHAIKIKGIPFAEHVPDLTSKKDITIVEEYVQLQYPKFI